MKSKARSLKRSIKFQTDRLNKREDTNFQYQKWKTDILKTSK